MSFKKPRDSGVRLWRWLVGRSYLRSTCVCVRVTSMGFGSRRRKIGFPAANKVYVSMLSASTLRSKSTFWRHLLIFVDLLSLHANGTYRTYMFAHTCKVRWLRDQKWEFTVPGAKKRLWQQWFWRKKTVEKGQQGRK